MFLVSQYNEIINMDYITKIVVRGKSIVAYNTDGDTIRLGSYMSEDITKGAFYKLMKYMIDGGEIFTNVP